ncbi:MAG: hypothetical protein ACLQDY_29365 [Streptosporangiaceae bacterium]
MQFLQISLVSQFGHVLDELRRRSPTSSGSAVSTGSLALDLHTGYRGLPRRGIVAIGGDVDGTERLAASTIEATTAAGGLAAVIGRFDDPPSWAVDADVVLDWQGQDESLRDVVANLANMADVVFVGTPNVTGLIDFITSTPAWMADIRACVIAMPEPVSQPDTTGDPTPDQLSQLRSYSDLVLQADRFEALPTPHLDIRVLKSDEPDDVVGIDYTVFGVEQTTDLLAAGRKLGLIRGGPHEAIRYGRVEIGKGTRGAASFLKNRPDMVASLRDQIQSVLKLPADAEVPGASEQATPGDASDGAGRYVNTWFEGDGPVLPLVVGRPVRFCLDIGPRSGAADAETVPFGEPDFGGQRSLRLLVTLYGDGIDVVTPNQVLTLPRVGRAEPPVETEVVPRRAEGCAIRILISLECELTMLQDLTVRPPVVPAEEALV